MRVFGGKGLAAELLGVAACWRGERAGTKASTAGNMEGDCEAMTGVAGG